MKTFKSEIIAIGTELLLGQVANTNAQWISEQLALEGMNTYYHTVVGDNLARVESLFSLAQDRSNLIIVSGGLGPTEDDMTREAFQNMSDIEMVEDKPSMDKIKTFFTKQDLEMTLNNHKQARVFQNATIINNQTGMAPGMIVDYMNKSWIFLPGVPREMKQMFTETVLPYLKKEAGQQTIIQSMIMRFIGIGEAKLEHELEDLIKNQTNPTIAPLAQADGLIIRLTAKENSLQAADILLNHMKEKILARVGDYVFGIDNETIIEKISEMLKKQNKRVSAAESLTGGKFTEQLISIDGASSICPGGIVCYDTEVKKSVLKVSPDTIDQYGVVSKECANEMAQKACEILDSDIGISFTGVAGPSSLEGHEAGTVYISIYSKIGEQVTEKFLFQGDRETIRNRTTTKGYEILFNYLKSMK